jgi:hypothetical protein
VKIPRKLRSIGALHASLPIINVNTNGPVTYANYFGFDGKHHTARVKCMPDNVPDAGLGQAILFYKILEREAKRYREKVLFKQIKKRQAPDALDALAGTTIDFIRLDSATLAEAADEVRRFNEAPLTPITDKAFVDGKATDSIKDSFIE